MSHGSPTSTTGPALTAPPSPPSTPQSSRPPQSGSQQEQSSRRRRNKAPPTFHFLAGLATGSLSAVLLQPADLLKTRVQQSRGSSLGATLREILAQPAVFRSLWRGTLPSVIRTGFGSALYFASLNALRGSLAGHGGGGGAVVQGESTAGRLSTGSGRDANATASNNGHAQTTVAARPIVPTPTAAMPIPSPSPSSSALPKLSNAANLATGALARAGAGLVMMPITVLKVRYESSMYGSYNSLSLASAGRAILAREGLRGLYAGYGATLVRDAPYAGLYVLFYEQAKGAFGRLLGENSGVGGRGGGMRAAQINFLAGCAAAAAATAVTNPFDAVKTRIQLMPHRYRNTAHAAATIVREDGARALFDGLALRMARKAMSSALAWTIYEDLVRRAEDYYSNADAGAGAGGAAAAV